jgi:hypothetical protein
MERGDVLDVPLAARKLAVWRKHRAKNLAGLRGDSEVELAQVAAAIRQLYILCKPIAVI